MKAKFLMPLVFGAALVAGGAIALADEATPAQPATPAPAVTAPTPNQVIYVPRLPTAQELTNAAAAQSVAIDQIVQTGAQVTVVYKYNTGQTSVVAYQILPTAGATQPAGTAPSTTVVYQQAPRTVYYSDPYYYPSYAYYPGYYWYPPVGVSIGLGYRWGWGGHFHGGFHGGHRW